MKATGIVRRIDDLGRIVVPKEIRRTMRIREGDPIEIFTGQEGEITLKKYSPIRELGTFAGSYAESLFQTTGHLVCITDRENVIAAAGPGKKNFEGKPLDQAMSALIDGRKMIFACRSDKNLIKVTEDDKEDFNAEAITTIVSSGDSIGAVVICAREEDRFETDSIGKLAQTAARFLGKQTE